MTHNFTSGDICDICGDDNARSVKDEDGSFSYCDHCFQLVYGRI